jgi:hypothetical protein
MAFKEVFDCEMLIAEIERRPAPYNCMLKEIGDKVLKERLWKEACKDCCF